MMETGFRGGSMLNINYFSVPESQLASVCAAAKLNENCFMPPTEDQLADYCKDPGFKKKFPFTEHLMRVFPGDMCNYNGGADARKRFLESFQSDGHQKLFWESALASDLLLASSVNVTKQVANGWIISRIQYDPTLLCKYAKPKTNLVTY